MCSPAPSIYAKRVRESATEYGLYVPKYLVQMTSWIENYDLNLHLEAIANRLLLILHGIKDERIPFSEPNNFYTKIKDQRYAKKIEYLVGKGEGHLVTTELMDVIADYFQKNI